MSCTHSESPAPYRQPFDIPDALSLRQPKNYIGLVEGVQNRGVPATESRLIRRG